MSNPDSAPSDPEALRLVHHHPGRIRLRSEALRGSENAAVARVRAALEQLPGVRRIDHEERNGGLLIEYEPGSIEPDALIGRVAEAARLDPPRDEREARRRRPPDLTWLVQTGRRMNTAVGELTGFRADLRIIIPVALVGMAIGSFIAGSGQRVPRWDNLVFWSISLTMRFFREEIKRAMWPQGAAEGSGAEPGSAGPGPIASGEPPQ